MAPTLDPKASSPTAEELFVRAQFLRCDAARVNWMIAGRIPSGYMIY